MKKWFPIKARGPSAGGIEIYDEIGALGIGAGRTVTEQAEREAST